jgi:AcrR family transcriptional regulator
MSPRPYRLGRRQPAAQRTRARVLGAARALLTARAGAEPFSVDAVARRAGVARMTVYHQFGSRRGLLEALFDSFAAGGELPAHLAAAFQRRDPRDTLADVIAAFARFWDAGRPWIRRVRALGVLDPELGDAVEARNGRRREVVRVVVERLGQRYGRPVPEERAQAEQLLYTLTSFETFDILAGPRRKLTAVAGEVLFLARAAVERPDDSGTTSGVAPPAAPTRR